MQNTCVCDKLKAHCVVSVARSLKPIAASEPYGTSWEHIDAYINYVYTMNEYAS